METNIVVKRVAPTPTKRTAGQQKARKKVEPFRPAGESKTSRKKEEDTSMIQSDMLAAKAAAKTI